MRHLLLTVITLLLLADLVGFDTFGDVSPGQTECPFVGRWRLNVSRSKLPAGLPRKTAKLRVQSTAEKITVISDSIDDFGVQQTSTSEYYLDGKEHSLVENPGVVQVTSWDGARALKVIRKKDGNVYAEFRFEVSTDATVLTIFAKDPSAKGEPEIVMIFDREQYQAKHNDAPDNKFNGYDFWLNKLNHFNGDYLPAEMVKAFIESTEYRQRFGQ